MLDCSGLTVTYTTKAGSVTPLNAASFHAAGGSVALIGPSGSGKSTLLRVISGIQAPDTGTVLIDGVEVSWSASNPEMHPVVSLIHQDYRLISFLTVEENLNFARTCRSLPAESNEAVAEILAELDLAGFGSRMPETLSGGEQQRVAIARALLVGSRLILADEPTGSLDTANSVNVAMALAHIAASGKAMVVVATHDMAVAGNLDETVDVRTLSR